MTKVMRRKQRTDKVPFIKWIMKGTRDQIWFKEVNNRKKGFSFKKNDSEYC